MTARTAETLRHAIAAHQRGDLAAAGPAYEAVLRADPDNFDALHMLGVIRLQQRRNDEALWLLQSAIRRRPRSAEAFSNLGIALQSLGRFDDAVEAFDRALAINRRYANAHFGRGNALLAQRDYPAALASFDTMLASNPTFVPDALDERRSAAQLCRRADLTASGETLTGGGPDRVAANP